MVAPIIDFLKALLADQPVCLLTCVSSIKGAVLGSYMQLIETIYQSFNSDNFLSRSSFEMRKVAPL